MKMMQQKNKGKQNYKVILSCMALFYVKNNEKISKKNKKIYKKVLTYRVRYDIIIYVRRK